MRRLENFEEREYSPLTRVLFGLDSPAAVFSDLDDPERGCGSVEFIDQTLNNYQKDAVRFALASREIALIHGPPGVSRAYHGSYPSNIS